MWGLPSWVSVALLERPCCKDGVSQQGESGCLQGISERAVVSILNAIQVSSPPCPPHHQVARGSQACSNQVCHHLSLTFSPRLNETEPDGKGKCQERTVWMASIFKTIQILRGARNACALRRVFWAIKI